VFAVLTVVVIYDSFSYNSCHFSDIRIFLLRNFSRWRGGQILGFSIDLHCHHYNSRITVQVCDNDVGPNNKRQP